MTDHARSHINSHSLVREYTLTASLTHCDSHVVVESRYRERERRYDMCMCVCVCVCVRARSTPTVHESTTTTEREDGWSVSECTYTHVQAHIDALTLTDTLTLTDILTQLHSVCACACECV